MIKLFKYMRTKDWILAAICLLFVAGQVWLDLLLPDYMKEITVLITSSTSDLSSIWIAGGKMIACAFGSAGFAVVVGYFAAKIAADFSSSVREAEFNKISDYGISEMKKFSVPSLITRTTNDVTQIQMVVAMGLQAMIKAPILAVWALVKIFGKSWELSIVIIVCVVVLLVAIITLMALVLPKFKKVQKQVDAINRVADENLTGIKVVRAFNAENYQERKFEKVNDDLTKTQLFTMRAMSVLQPLLTIVMSGLSLALYWVGSSLIDGISNPAERVALFGDLVAFSTYGTYIVMAFLLLAATFMVLPRAQVSANRINEVLTQEISVKEGKNTFSEVKDGTIEFKNVSFRYAGSPKDFLQNISFKADKGETIAIIGATGCGKTTLVELAARLYDATEGQVLIDGYDVKEYSFEGLYNKIGYISQKSVLFSDTVSGNVGFGETEQEITEEDILSAIDIAQGADFVKDMTDGINSQISQGGTNISGGQKQRLSIARAIARKPEILIFDDSFSALDFKTDSKLRARIKKDLSETTCVVVASRIGTIKDADKIIVLDNGKAVGIGTHKELLHTCETYRDIALSQLSSAELAEGEL